MTKVIEFEHLKLAERVYLKNKAEKSFLNFTRIMFELLQGDKLLVNWHHKWMAHEVDEVVRRGHHSRNLAVSMPPGGTKTEFWSIHLPAYVNMLVQTDKLSRFRNLNLSFADTLVTRNSRRTRDIIKSKEYQELWPCQFGVNQAEEWEIINKKGKVVGQTISRAMGGQITGGRAGFFGDEFSGALTLDDPDKPEDMFSPTRRNAQHRKMTNTVRSRRGDKSKEHPTPFFIIQQRLHKEDTIGFCLSGGLGVDFKEIKIPALISEEYINTLPEWVQKECWKSILGTESRMIGGVEYWSYWPEMEDIGQLIDLMERDEYTFWSQYMQAPREQSGNLVDTANFGRYTVVPPLEYMAVYVDTNSGKVKDKNDYNVFNLCGKGIDGNIYVLDVVRGKWTPSGLLEIAGEKWDEWRSMCPVHARVVLRYMSIEDKQAGQGLITELKMDNGIPVKAVERGTNQNKWMRHCNTQPKIQQGKIFVPQTYEIIYDEEGNAISTNKLEYTKWSDGSICRPTDWVVPFLAECDAITAGILLDTESGYDDQYDTLMDAVDDMLDASTIDYGKLK